MCLSVCAPFETISYAYDDRCLIDWEKKLIKKNHFGATQGQYYITVPSYVESPLYTRSIGNGIDIVVDVFQLTDQCGNTVARSCVFSWYSSTPHAARYEQSMLYDW